MHRHRVKSQHLTAVRILDRTLAPWSDGGDEYVTAAVERCRCGAQRAVFYTRPRPAVGRWQEPQRA
jgi:hypothetical protein